MVAGIVFQLAAVLVFSVLFFIVVKRALGTQSDVLKERKIRALIVGTTLSVICVIIRSIYRTIELSEGWEGYLITHQSYFIGLDGVMVGVLQVFISSSRSFQELSGVINSLKHTFKKFERLEYWPQFEE
jgi:hypothetical protein